MRILRILPLAGAAVLVLSAAAHGIINPNFTPLHLVEQSDLILQLAVRAAKEPDLLRATVARPLKGKAAADAFTIDLGLLEKGHVEELRAALAGDAPHPGMLFSGQCGEEGAERQAKIFFHANGKWLELSAAGEGRYRASPEDPNLEPTWAGGTDMLVRAVGYALAAAQPDFPVRSGIVWAERQDLGKLEGRVRSARPVDLDGTLQRCLHIGAEGGDRLYRWDADAGAFKDVTAQRGLSARSAASVWGDFNADGRLDLASWDGKSLGLHLQAGDGSFAARPVEIAAALKDGCMGLAALDCGRAGRPALLASTPGWPVLLVPEADGGWAARPLGEGALDRQNLGAASPCLVADFDGDRVGDVLQLFEKGGLLYRGKGRGAFEPARALAIRSGGGGAPPGRGAPAPFTADFDADGRLDVFVTGADRCRLWQNTGELRFEEWLGRSGETAYNCAENGIGGAAGDFNNDGRQDLLILYPDAAPQLFFNRGFRSFGHAPDLAPSAQKLGMDVRQQAGCLGDFNGDGAQDLALVLREGQVCVLPAGQEDEGETALSVTVLLEPGRGYAGPLTVTGYREDRCLGAWNVVAGSAEALFGLREPGAVTLKWQAPGGPAQEKKVLLEEKPLRFVLTPPE